MISLPVQILLVLSAAVSLAVAGYVRQSRTDAPGARALVAMLLAVTLWSATYLLQLKSPTLGGKLFWARFVATGSVGSALAYFVFVLRYTGRDGWLTRARWGLLVAVPILSVGMAWTNNLHELIWADPRIARYGTAALLSTTKGAGFVLTIGYGYALVLAATLLVVELAWRSEPVHQGQAWTILLAALIPWLGSALFYGLPRAVTPYDPTPLLFSATALVLAVSLYRFHMFDLVPVPPDRMIRELRDAAVVLDGQDRVSHLNPAARDLFGVEGDAVGTAASDLFPQWSDVRAAGGERLRHEGLRLAVDGEPRFFDLRASSLSDYRGRSLGRLLVLRDVTERRERERTLEEYRRVFETVKDAVYVVAADGTVRLVNDSLAEMFGTTPAALQGRHVSDVVDRPAYEAGVDLVAELVASGRTSGVLEFELTDATGAVVPCESEVALLSDEDGLRGCVGTVRDITKRKRAQRSLAETTSTLETIFAASPVAIVTVDRSLEVTRWNAAAERILGWRPEAVRGRLLPALDGPDGDTARRCSEAALAGETVTNREQRWPTKGGVDRHVGVSAAPLSAADGDVVGAVFVVADITDRKYREQQLDVLNRVLRHNLRNDLSVILPSVEALGDDLPDEEREQVVDVVVDRARQLVDYAAKARQAEQIIDRGVTRVEHDLVSVVERTVAAARSRHPKATFAVSVDDGAPRDGGAARHVGTGRDGRTGRDGAPRVDDGAARGDDTVAVVAQASLDTALANLLDNAVVHNDRPEPSVEVTVTAEGDDAAVVVADDGPGIPKEERQVLLTGEETPLHHGSGIGLWLVHWIVERSGGELSFAANEPRGSVVTMRLPRTTVGVEPESTAR